MPFKWIIEFLVAFMISHFFISCATAPTAPTAPASKYFYMYYGKKYNSTDIIYSEHKKKLSSIVDKINPNEKQIDGSAVLIMPSDPYIKKYLIDFFYSKGDFLVYNHHHDSWTLSVSNKPKMPDFSDLSKYNPANYIGIRTPVIKPFTIVSFIKIEFQFYEELIRKRKIFKYLNIKNSYDPINEVFNEDVAILLSANENSEAQFYLKKKTNSSKKTIPIKSPSDTLPEVLRYTLLLNNIEKAAK